VFSTRYAEATMGSFSLREKVRMRGCQLWIVDWGLPIEEESPEHCLLNPQSAFVIPQFLTPSL
jgi:hypothetical protein